MNEPKFKYGEKVVMIDDPFFDTIEGIVIDKRIIFVDINDIDNDCLTYAYDVKLPCGNIISRVEFGLQKRNNENTVG